MRDIGLSEVVCMILCVFKFLCIFLAGGGNVRYKISLNYNEEAAGF